MALFLFADFHEGDERFSVHSRGKVMCFYDFIGASCSPKYSIIYPRGRR
jgi:hypothetical protein